MNYSTHGERTRVLQPDVIDDALAAAAAEAEATEYCGQAMQELMWLDERATHLQHLDDTMGRYRDCTFRNFDPWFGLDGDPHNTESERIATEREDVKTAVKQWVNSHITGDDEHPDIWLSIASRQNGTGKTHLAAAAARVLALNYGPVRWVDGAGMFSEAKETFRRDSGWSFSAYMNHLVRFPVLVIDELGAHAGTEFELRFLRQLVSSRYDDERLTIITTNAVKLKTLLHVPNNPTEDTQLAVRQIASRLAEGRTRVRMGEDWPDARTATPNRVQKNV